MIENILLVGTNHQDFFGPTRLQKILEWYKPDVVSVECTQDMLDDAIQSYQNLAMFKYVLIKQNFESSVSKEDDISLVSNYLYSLCYEPRVVKQYSLKNNISAFGVETTESRGKNVKIDGGEKGSFKFISLNSYNQKVVDATYSRVMRLDIGSLDYMVRRDAFMVNKIKNLHGRVLHVSGAAHIFGDYYNLFDRLENLNPVRVNLLFAEKL